MYFRLWCLVRPLRLGGSLFSFGYVRLARGHAWPLPVAGGVKEHRVSVCSRAAVRPLSTCSALPSAAGAWSVVGLHFSKDFLRDASPPPGTSMRWDRRLGYSGTFRGPVIVSHVALRMIFTSGGRKTLWRNLIVQVTFSYSWFPCVGGLAIGL